MAAVLAAAPADTVVKTDGTVYEGKILEEKTSWIIMEVHKGQAKFTIPIPRVQVKSIVHGQGPRARSQPAQPAGEPVGPGYYPLPIKGQIGIDVRAEFLAEALKEVRAKKPDYVVLYFDSPGGSVQEMVRVLDVLEAARKELRIVALVRRALSTAAVLAMACPEIYITPAGQIGRAAGPGPDEQGQIVPLTSAEQQEVRRRLPEVARQAGHPELVAQAMVDPKVEMCIRVQDGKPGAFKGRGGRVICTKGELLLLGGRDAVDAALAKGIGDDVATLHEDMGLKGWHVVRGGGWYLMTRRAREYRRKLEQARRKERRDAYMASIAPRLEELKRRLRDINAKGKDAERRKAEFIRRFDRAVADIRSDYRADLREAERHREKNPDYADRLRREAKRRRDRRLEDLRQRNKPEANRIQKQIKRWLQEKKLLIEEREKLLRGIPK
ncbi:MAG: hypothetical protein B1H04_01250 [Planctomycetales bacterium 4484_123]|nr:MAG: hypothetical protein B1H04_01250 [Planctomycetales bacterium 4484_123]